MIEIARLEVVRLFDDDAAAGDDEAIADAAEFARRVVVDLAVIVAGADQELVGRSNTFAFSTACIEPP